MAMKLQLPGKLYGLLFVGIGLAAAGSYFAFRSENEQRKNLTAELPATVTSTEVRRLAHPDTGMEQAVDVIVTYQYESDGQKYEQVIRMSKMEANAFAPWGRAKVCYDPADPSTIATAKLFPLSHQCGS